MTRYNITESFNYYLILIQVFTTYTRDLIYKQTNELSNSLFWQIFMIHPIRMEKPSKIVFVSEIIT